MLTVGRQSPKAAAWRRSCPQPKADSHESEPPCREWAVRLEVELRERGGRRREEHEERGDQSLQDEAVQWLQEYIRINTTNPPGNETTV